jgi:GNAT superfamily N-acetyltransferase
MGNVQAARFDARPTQPKLVWLSCRHRAAIAGHMQRLDHADRVRRFGRPLSDSDIIVFAAALDPARDWLFGAFTDDDCLVGLAQATPTPNAVGYVVDAAVSVDKGWRGHGLGRALLGAILARVHGAANTAVVTIACPSLPQAQSLRRELATSHAAHPHEVCAGIRIEAEPMPHSRVHRAR